MDFNTLVTATHKARKTTPIDPTMRIICFDPGHTTGWAFFEGTKLTAAGQINTKPIEEAVINITDLLDMYTPDMVVFEDYRVYKWKTEHHGGSELLTTRVIGCIETLCIQKQIYPIIKQPAHTAKGFCKDSKLKEWGLYIVGERHARDAIRHGCYFLLFGQINSKDPKPPRSTVG